MMRIIHAKLTVDFQYSDMVAVNVEDDAGATKDWRVETQARELVDSGVGLNAEKARPKASPDSELWAPSSGCSGLLSYNPHFSANLLL
jgi:hypothetical protein